MNRIQDVTIDPVAVGAANAAAAGVELGRQALERASGKIDFPGIESGEAAKLAGGLALPHGVYSALELCGELLADVPERPFSVNGDKLAGKVSLPTLREKLAVTEGLVSSCASALREYAEAGSEYITCRKNWAENALAKASERRKMRDAISDAAVDCALRGREFLRAWSRVNDDVATGGLVSGLVANLVSIISHRQHKIRNAIMGEAPNATPGDVKLQSLFGKDDAIRRASEARTAINGIVGLSHFPGIGERLERLQQAMLTFDRSVGETLWLA